VMKCRALASAPFRYCARWALACCAGFVIPGPLVLTGLTAIYPFLGHLARQDVASATQSALVPGTRYMLGLGSLSIQ
jgi:hypothetical protein